MRMMLIILRHLVEDSIKGLFAIVTSRMSFLILNVFNESSFPEFSISTRTSLGLVYFSSIFFF